MLEEENAQLEEENAQLEEENAQLKEENAQLEEAVDDDWSERWAKKKRKYMLAREQKDQEIERITEERDEIATKYKQELDLSKKTGPEMDKDLRVQFWKAQKQFEAEILHVRAKNVELSKEILRLQDEMKRKRKRGEEE